MNKLKYILIGFLFGFVLIKAEVVSWFRIQEMFRFQSFHMYGVICSALAVGMVSIWLIKKNKTRTVGGEEIVIADKKYSKGNIIGGLMFGLGWAMTGACPGPIFALIGSGLTVMIVVLLSALLGTYTYGVIRDRLPH